MAPSEFWGCDTWSVIDAHEGYLDDVHLRLTGKRRAAAQGGLSKDEFEALKQWMDEDDD